uniref:Uncharacterized protein n=1 Tax=Oryza glumipatula TaxID=40148 RepID=A0A0E0BQP6_9ORYZ
MSPLPTTADGEGVAATLEPDTTRAMSRLAARKEAMGGSTSYLCNKACPVKTNQVSSHAGLRDIHQAKGWVEEALSDKCKKQDTAESRVPRLSGLNRINKGEKNIFDVIDITRQESRCVDIRQHLFFITMAEREAQQLATVN